ncbi:MAG: triphosphoribosyl-dephospho-CoA synthase [Gemmataceae bacterium]|nr:triphosphoribosyl-dephospho-CoA synthase [Gemmata sp.]MDW8197411.1 triphosphoribosyl-dephospho-CoA synthase [Gemmataceae bacterium]
MNSPWPNATLAQVACIWEAVARKIGNVHRYADFPTTHLTDFLLSAAAIHHAFCQTQHASLGEMIWSAVRETQAMVGQNTNLGIILLLVPLLRCRGDTSLRNEVTTILQKLTRDDALWTYRAIRLANPGGLGRSSEHDVHEEPTVSLLEAMHQAADRDAIARQYATGYADVFDFGVPAFQEAVAKFGTVEAAIIDTQLHWLARFPDSLIARKNGPAVAEAVQRQAAAVLQRGGIATPSGRAAAVALDRSLRSAGSTLNPGTTADLITACLFVALRENKVTPTTPFHWDVPDWL